MQDLNSLKQLLLNQKERNKELDELLTYPEILADQRLTQYLLKEQRDIAPFVLKQREIEDLQDELSIMKELNEDDENIHTIENKIEEKYLSVNKLLANSIIDAYDGVCVEINTLDLVIKNKIFNEYLNFACKNKLEYEYGLNLNIYGKNVFSKLDKTKGKYNVDGVNVQIYIFPYLNIQKEINPKELKIDYYHSSGAGGQNINKVETAVRVTHLATSISVTCQDERSQKQNKEKALIKIQDKVYAFKMKQYEDLIKESRARQQKLVKQIKLDSASKILIGV